MDGFEKDRFILFHFDDLVSSKSCNRSSNDILLNSLFKTTVILSIMSRYRYLTVTEREREGCPK